MSRKKATGEIMGKNGYDLLLLSHRLAVMNLELCGLKIGIRSCPIGKSRENGANPGRLMSLNDDNNSEKIKNNAAFGFLDVFSPNRPVLWVKKDFSGYFAP